MRKYFYWSGHGPSRPAPIGEANYVRFSSPVSYPVDNDGNVIGHELTACCHAPIKTLGGGSRVSSIFDGSPGANRSGWYASDFCEECNRRIGELRNG